MASEKDQKFVTSQKSYTLTKIILKTCGQYTSNGIHSKFHLEIMYFYIMITFFYESVWLMN